MPNLAQLPMTYLQNLLLTNPNAATFPFSTTDFPLGNISRASVLAAFTANLGPTNSGNFDPTTGKFNSQTIAPGIIVNAGIQVTQGVQINVAVPPSALPVVSPGAAFAGLTDIVQAPAQVI